MTASVCATLGFRPDNFILLRRSNEHPNIHFAIEHLQHGVNSESFPQLLPYLNSSHKSIIHCSTINQVYRVYVYLWNAEPDGTDHLRRVRMYFSSTTVKLFVFLTMIRTAKLSSPLSHLRMVSIQRRSSIITPLALPRQWIKYGINFPCRYQTAPLRPAHNYLQRRS